MRTAAVILILIGVAGGGAAFYAKQMAGDPVTSYQTVAIKRGDLLSTISATGTAEPEEVVDVGAQVMGLILEFGHDPHDPSKLIDYNSVVEKGAVLAKIDPTPYEAALEQAEATLAHDKANLGTLTAVRDQTKQEFKRAKELLPSKAISETDYDTEEANYKSAEANLEVGKAQVRVSAAAVRTAKTNLGYTTITSPVRGTILDRRVNIGQTVVASLNAPSLFLIAKDLRRMQVWASVNEADIGRIRVNMPARFTVDAYPGQTFRGKVSQIRMNATMTQNVVTYTVVVTTDNSNGKLMPYLTANVQFEVDQRSNVLLAPNAALRWKPQASQIDPAISKTVSTNESTSAEGRGCRWVESDPGLVRPVEVAIGASDGTMTEISGIGVREGMQVVAGEQGKEDQEDENAAEGEKTSNPFLPKIPKGSRPPPGPM